MIAARPMGEMLKGKFKIHPCPLKFDYNLSHASKPYRGLASFRIEISAEKKDQIKSRLRFPF